MRKTSQREIVIRQLKTNGYISRNWCLQNYISRLSAIIYQLREEGWDFKEEWVSKNGGRNYVYHVTKSPYQRVTYKVEGQDKEITIFK